MATEDLQQLMPENNFDQSWQSMACFKQTSEKLALYSSDFNIYF